MNLIEESAEVYHANAKTHLSSSRLKRFAESPCLASVPQEDSPAFKIGRAVHSLVLENDQWWHPGGPVNEKTGKEYGEGTKAWQAFEAEHGPALPMKTHNMIIEMRGAVLMHEEANRLLTGGIAERVRRREVMGVKCQARFDYLKPDVGLIVDLKTTDDLTWFESSARRYQYGLQLAFYRKVYGERGGTCIVAVEKKAPYRVGVWDVTSWVALEVERVDKLIAEYGDCERQGVWPSRYEQVREITA